MIDTGSYELWVNPVCLESPDPMLCGTYGTLLPAAVQHVIVGGREIQGDIWDGPSRRALLFGLDPDLQYAPPPPPPYFFQPQN